MRVVDEIVYSVNVINPRRSKNTYATLVVARIKVSSTTGPTRSAYLAGRWYPGTKDALKKTIEDCFLSAFGPGRLPPVPPLAKAKGDGEHVMGIIAPHAGLSYSGGIAANGYLAIAEAGAPDAFILIASHGGFDDVLIQDDGTWETPLGKTRVDRDIARAIGTAGQAIKVANEEMVDFEYTDNTFELQLLFMQYIAPAATIVPIAAGSRAFPKLHAAAGQLSTALNAYMAANGKKRVAIVASTDLTHYGSHYGFMPAIDKSIDEQNQWVRDNDARVLDMILHLNDEDPGRILDEAMESHNICCPGAIILALDTFKQLSRKKNLERLGVKLLKQATSHDVMPDRFGRFAAVGYASMLFEI